MLYTKFELEVFSILLLLKIYNVIGISLLLISIPGCLIFLVSIVGIRKVLKYTTRIVFIVIFIIFNIFLAFFFFFLMYSFENSSDWTKNDLFILFLVTFIIPTVTISFLSIIYGLRFLNQVISNGYEYNLIARSYIWIILLGLIIGPSSILFFLNSVPYGTDGEGSNNNNNYQVINYFSHFKLSTCMISLFLADGISISFLLYCLFKQLKRLTKLIGIYSIISILTISICSIVFKVLLSLKIDYGYAYSSLEYYHIFIPLFIGEVLLCLLKLYIPVPKDLQFIVVTESVNPEIIPIIVERHIYI